jgi:CheY-like chemotaxis protein
MSKLSPSKTGRKQALDRETRRQLWLEKVLELGKTVAQVTDWQACLFTIYESIRRGLEFDRAGIFLYELEHNLVRGVYGTNRAGEWEEISWYAEPVDKHSVFQELASSPKGFVFTPDYTARFSLAPEDQMYGVREHVMVAAWAGDKPVAALAVDNLITGRPMTEEQLEALRVFADYVGLAIENARLYEAVQYELAERKLAEAGRVALIAELEAKNTELERFTYTVSHDLKSPLITIKGFLGFLEQSAITGDIAQLRADIARITNATDKMQQLLDELLELSRIGRMINPPEAVLLGDLAREAVSMVAGRLAERGVDVVIAPDLPAVYGDRARLREVLENLVDPGGLSGSQLVQQLISDRPTMKILYMSGYTDNAIVHHGVLAPGVAFLQKPFTPDALARKVREVLDTYIPT